MYVYLNFNFHSKQIGQSTGQPKGTAQQGIQRLCWLQRQASLIVDGKLELQEKNLHTSTYLQQDSNICIAEGNAISCGNLALFAIHGTQGPSSLLPQGALFFFSPVKFQIIEIKKKQKVLQFFYFSDGVLLCEGTRKGKI